MLPPAESLAKSRSASASSAQVTKIDVGGAKVKPCFREPGLGMP
jgi:hypothetical protein